MAATHPRIAVLGWGSLIWDPRGLPIEGAWGEDGPELGVEFARKSSDGRITLVVSPDVEPVKVLWNCLNVNTTEQARKALADRENSEAIAVLSLRAATNDTAEAKKVYAWAEGHEVEHVIWTALPPRNTAGVRGVMPTSSEIVEYLRKLQGDIRVKAERYVRRTPKQIKTRYRTQIEKDLGWVYSEDW
jgi:hypothetical protein